VDSPIDQENRGPVGAGDCGECGAPLSGDQRYCVACGTRRGSLPAAVAAHLNSLVRRDRGQENDEAEPPVTDPTEKPKTRPASMPTPRAAAVAVMAMLAFGVVIGSATSQLAQSAGLTSILLEVASPPPEEEPEEVAAAAPEPAPEPTEPVFATPSSVPEELIPEIPPPEETPPEPEPPPEFEEEPGLPDVKHVFLSLLGENLYEESFGASASSPYLAKTLPEQGELLPNYYAVTSGNLANQIALISGQGPTAETAANCPNYGDLVPATATAEGQVEGNGCVYPAPTKTLPDLLSGAGLKWKAYVEDIGNGTPTGQPATCRHPALGSPDPSQLPIPGDAYETWRNPFVYFHSLIDDSKCAETDVGLDRLAGDLKKATKTPTLSYIVPNACHDGGEVPCEPTQPAGTASAEAFLETVVPEIKASDAYKEGGLIAITSTQAPQLGEHADPSSCCATPAYPNLPPAPEAEPGIGGVKPLGGGGKVGLLLISPFVEAGSVNEAGYFNHYILLLTLEELFGLEKLGYANESLLPFDSTVFNAPTTETGEEPEEPEKPKESKEPAQSKRISKAVSKPRPTAPTVNVRSGHGVPARKRPSSSAFSTATRWTLP
jgi:hypothetical protein